MNTTNTLTWLSVSNQYTNQTFAASIIAGIQQPLFVHEEAERAARAIVNAAPELTIVLTETEHASDGHTLYTIAEKEAGPLAWEIHEEEPEEEEEEEVKIETLEGEWITEEEAEEMEYCEYYEARTAANTYEVRTGTRWGTPRRQQWSERAIDANELYYFDGSYYDIGALYYYDLCLNEDTNEVDYQSDCYQWEDGTWHGEEEDSDSLYIDNYHHRQSQPAQYFNPEGERSEYLIGYEIEKEDEEAKYSVKLRDLYSKHPKWRKERDGSLDSSTGYELISPPLELQPQKIEAMLKRCEVLTQHVNAAYSSNCGGHIHLSQENTSGLSLYNSIQGYTPLLHAMYPNRADNVSFCSAKSIDKMKAERDRYQSINILGNRIEFRIFSAVKNVDNLIWRTELIALMLEHQTDNPRKAFYNLHNALKKHFLKVYTPEVFERLSARVIRYTRKFEQIDPQDGQTTLF
jgi:hypothetical protein